MNVKNLLPTLLVLPALLWPVLARAAEGTAAVESTEVGLSYNRDVLPILAANCFACHGFDKKGREASLRLDTAEGATAVLDSGERAIVPGDPGKSELVRRITSDDEDAVMPPRKTGKRLTAAQKQVLRQWIEEGGRYERHWAFLPPKKAPPPVTAGTEHPIDGFIAARLAKAQLRPSPRADDETLIRRVSLDLTGLPPTLPEIDAFLAESARDRQAAYARLVDRLLASPHYGERWGRWWLDQARYADSNGYSIDAPRQIWKYRDWVVNALNADLPFTDFTIDQLAGDLLPSATEAQKIATGFHRNTQINQEGGIDREQFRVDSVFDRVATTGTVWLGLSVGCAQCHDHKFDPIEQKEYYRLFAFLNSQDEPMIKVYDAGVNPAALAAELKQAEQELADYLKEHATEATAWEAELTKEAHAKLSADARKTLAAPREKRSFAQTRSLFAEGLGKSDEQFVALNSRYLALDSRLNSAPTTMVLKELPQPRKTTVFIKGDFTRPADEVFPGTPSVLHPLDKTDSRVTRLDLARWIASPQNPLTPRVIVNRVWQQYFGRGIVETDNDFGLQGTPPSHPELLDWLAVKFVERGFRLKDLHRLIVTSHTYQQSSRQRPDLRAKDPHNYLLGRQQRLRLEAELVRDAALTASGLLAEKLAGPPVYPPIPDGVMGVGQVKHAWPVSPGGDKYRRGIYTFLYRASPPPSLNVFDSPDGYFTCTRRIRSNTPLQALAVMNDPAFFEFAQALGQIIEREGLPTAFRRCTSRSPRADELALLETLDPQSAARVLLNLDETITRE